MLRTLFTFSKIHSNCCSDNTIGHGLQNLTFLEDLKMTFYSPTSSMDIEKWICIENDLSLISSTSIRFLCKRTSIVYLIVKTIVLNNLNVCFDIITINVILLFLIIHYHLSLTAQNNNNNNNKP